MALFVKVAGTWQEIPDGQRVYVKIAGVWQVITDAA